MRSIHQTFTIFRYYSLAILVIGTGVYLLFFKNQYEKFRIDDVTKKQVFHSMHRREGGQFLRVMLSGDLVGEAVVWIGADSSGPATPVLYGVTFDGNIDTALTVDFYGGRPSIHYFPVPGSEGSLTIGIK